MNPSLKRIKVLVIGYKGEVGGAIYKLCRRKYVTHGLDVGGFSVKNFKEPGDYDIVHVCVPSNLVSKVLYQWDLNGWGACGSNALVIINSTVPIGFMKGINYNIVYSPIRGKHPKIYRDLFRYPKWVSCYDKASAKIASDHFRYLGLKTFICRNPQTAEVAKMNDTGQYGWEINWSQAMKMLCDKVDADFDQAYTKWDHETDRWTPRTARYPGVIGGHCVIPNSRLLAPLMPLAGVIQDQNRLFEEHTKKDKKSKRSK
jgi:hypothetical protein